MTSAVSPITQFQSGSYLTIAEYKNAPTAIDYNNLVTGGTSAQQDAELASVIQRASSWIDIYVNQPLIAQNFLEQCRGTKLPILWSDPDQHGAGNRWGFAVSLVREIPDHLPNEPDRSFLLFAGSVVFRLSTDSPIPYLRFVQLLRRIL